MTNNVRIGRRGWMTSAALTLGMTMGMTGYAQAQTGGAGSFGGLGYLMYRVYLPTGGAGKVVLPNVNYTYSDGRPSRTITPCTTTLGLTAAGLANLSAGTSTCAWLFSSGGGSPAVGLNIAYPDTSAIYWVTPFEIDPAVTITVNGQFPDARYISFNVYDANMSSYFSAGVSSGLPDYLITPDAGSVNPWQQPAAAGGRFTVRVSAQAGAGNANVIPMPPPASGKFSALPQPCSGAACPPLNRFVQSPLGGLFPNVDVNYVTALTQPKAGQVLVMRGKLPSSVVGDQAMHPVPWPAPGLQVRYWSLCNNVYMWPYPVNTCVPDYLVKTDSQGYFTAVASSAADRPKNATTANGVAWLQNSVLFPKARHMMIVRNMLPNAFEQAIQNVAPNSGPEATEAVMGAYYPKAWVCAKSTFESGGWQACAR